jgi:hypothetical protein
VLQGFASLTALSLYGVVIKDAHEAPTSLAALPDLRSLTWNFEITTSTMDTRLPLLPAPDLQHLTQLTKLHADMERLEQLSQLTALTNLVDLDVQAIELFTGRLPGGLPSQLQQLTALSIDLSGKDNFYPEDATGQDAAELFQHLSTFTALQQLSATGDCPVQTGAFSSIQGLSQLTSLSLDLRWLTFDVASTHTCA